MKLRVMGTANAVAFHYHSTFFVLDDGKDCFLVDGGGGNEVLLQLSAADIDIPKIHYGFLSHAHTDHIFGMIYMLRAVGYFIDRGYYEGNFTLFTNKETAETFVSLAKLVLKKGDQNLIGTRFIIKVVEDGEEADILGKHFEFFDIKSTKMPQFGFRMTYKEDTGEEKVITFLGDEPLREGVEKYLIGSDWMFSESFCLYAHRDIYEPEKMHHATVKEAAENAEKYGVKNLVIWHTEDDMTFGTRKELYTAEAKQYYSGNVFVPDDLEVIDL